MNLAMDLTQLKRFLAAAEAGNLRRAASRLHVSQPALTQSIKNLEISLGERLFDRTVRGVVLTPFGHALIPRARMILSERERIAHDLEEIRSGTSARVTVGVGPYFSRQLFPTALLRTLDSRPGAKVQVVEGHTLDLVRMLREGEIEFAFCVGNPFVERDKNLTFEPLYTEHYSILARNGHPLFRRRRVSDKDIAAYPWVVHEAPAIGAYLDTYFLRLNLTPPVRSITTLSLSLMVALLMRSDLLALLPEDFVHPEVAASRLRRVVGHGMKIDGPGGIVTRRDAVLGQTAKSLIANLRAVCEDVTRRSTTRSRNSPAAAATSSGASSGG